MPGLDAEKYVSGEHLLGVALSTLMAVPAERRAELFLEGLQRIAVSGENDFRRMLLAECLEAYSDLDAGQKERLQALATSEPYKEAKNLMITTFERSVAQGVVQGRRETLLLQLETKFGPLAPEARHRVEALTSEELQRKQIDILKAASLEELGLGGGSAGGVSAAAVSPAES